ncbi:MAG: aldehyde reductase [Deltaproteobacteria bacterium]|nr:aldehyde reductase [Deltaproteobacteria bacterium]
MAQTSDLVCVTGASGFIATQLVKALLEGGYRVRGTVRDPKKADVLRGLDGAKDRLELVAADLLDADSMQKAIAGTHVVMHTASPYVITVKDPQRDLVDPALKGTEHALAACRAAGVKRVVLTSSCAAITDAPDGRVLTEADWNEKSSLTRNPYYYSKTVAERAAWAFVEKEKPSFDLVTINPALVIGPSLIRALNPSSGVIADLLNGKQPAVVRLEWGIVDVRDVAKAHILAMETASAKGRYICTAGMLDMSSLVATLKKHGLGKGKLPKLSLASPVGDVVAKIFSYTQPKGIGQYVRTNVGGKLIYDNQKIVRELAMRFRAIEESIVETAADLAKWGHVEARAA